MAELSSNWKKLQARLQAEEAPQPPCKRKADGSSTHHRPARRPKATVEPVTSSRKQDIYKRHTSRARRPEMGGVQSSVTESEPGDGSSPSLALWAQGSDISAETLAEAYGLGLKGDFIAMDGDRINHGLSANIEPGKFVALDCEMVGIGSGGYKSALARASLVDFHGRQIYDSFVKPKEKVTNWRTEYSGITSKDMKLARDFDQVQAQVSRLLKDRILVGHDLRHDLAALKLSHPRRDIRDTANYPGFKKLTNGQTPSLRLLAKELLGVRIHDEAHSSIEDARVTMLLFRKNKSGIDGDHAGRFASKHAATTRQKGKRKIKARTGK
ncbi:hypothetical protein L249_4924 [Ophiocordyceps polyrhachis-furcata BCC 54312]|uniref:RNA exonuclease 4 n=1 Tax=Ophiocordyceps polyrhachis-furcata BCC 54312 TaxID=1330021 RepID=A0A367L3X6_9HYPO|nr:hypothetical protein L249_4924 [Ophiocordyceps polyrhachis-furcata BCC 54312]